MTAAARTRSFEELYAEIRALPEGAQGEILTPGEVHITMGRPAKPHRRAAQQLFRGLDGADHASTKGGWWLEIEPEVRFGAQLFDPDLAGWRVERVPDLPDEQPIEILPDWVCEILSPSTERNDLLVKLPVYAERGVPHIWIVDPRGRFVQVYAPTNGKPTLIASASDEVDIRRPPFDLDVHPAQWWLPLETAK